MPCNICHYNTEKLTRNTPSDEISQDVEMVLMKFLGFDGNILHHDFDRILRVNRKQENTNEDTFKQNTNQQGNFLKLFKPFKKDYPFEQEFCGTFIPFYVGDLDTYYVNKKCNLDKLSDLNIKMNFLNEKTNFYWKCDICENVISYNLK